MTIKHPDHKGNPCALPRFTAVPRKFTRHDGWTPERQRAFIEALADTGSVKHAAARVGMASEGAYALRRQPGAESFAAAWSAALAHGVRQLEDIALDRAIHGHEVPVYSYGKLVGTRRVFNDRLLMFILRNRAPDRFMPTSTAAASNGPERLTEEEWLERRRAKLCGEDVTERLRKALDMVRARHLADEAEARTNPYGKISIQGEERATFERWKAEQGLPSLYPLLEAAPLHDSEDSAEDWDF